jgi:hypothetical protein
LSLAVVRDLRERRAPASPEEIAQFETDVLAGFVLARASAGLADGTISSDVGHLEQVRTWFGKPLWDMEPSDADSYFGKVEGPTAEQSPDPGGLTSEQPGPRDVILHQRGFATEAIARGVPERDVQRHGRRKSRASMDPYIEIARTFDATNPTRWLD